MTRFTVPGRPVPKERPRFNTRTRHAYTPPRTQAYEAMVGWHARVARVMLTEKPIILRVRAYTHTKNHGDIDNIAKAVADALIGIAYVDDKQVQRIEAEWSLGEDRVEIEIEEAT